MATDGTGHEAKMSARDELEAHLDAFAEHADTLQAARNELDTKKSDLERALEDERRQSNELHQRLVALLEKARAIAARHKIPVKTKVNPA